MIKQLIMFIAYKTTENLVDTKRGTMGHFSRAIIFITFAFAINLVEIVLIVNSLFFKSKFDFTDEKFFLLYLAILRIRRIKKSQQAFILILLHRQVS